MQEMKYEELQSRAADAERLDAISALKAHAKVADVISQMKAEGKALTLTEEEEGMLWSFRRFKIRMRKHGEVFTWQTRLPEGIQLVQDTAEIVTPSEE